VPDRHEKTKSPYTADREFPGAFEGETVTRRRLVTGGGQALGIVAAASFTLPALAFALGPVFERQPTTWEAVGSPDDFIAETYVPKVITITRRVGEAGKTTVYMRKHDEAVDGALRDSYDAFIAISTRCMHLGCPVRYIEASQRFVCPCHGGVYDFTGRVTGGPPVRPLDRFYTRVRAGVVEVGPRYSVNSELKRFAPRDPGEPLDGIGPYLYPPRFSTPELPS
jgi:Rieske Fe-S protein